MAASATIHRLLQGSSVSCKESDVLVSAYKKTLRALCLVDRDDPLTKLIAQKIIEIGKTGPRDPGGISARAVKAFSLQSVLVPAAQGLAPFSEPIGDISTRSKEVPKPSISRSLTQALLPGGSVMQRYMARTNIDHYLSILTSQGLTDRSRDTIIKLMIAEEDKLVHDLERQEHRNSN